MTQTISQIDQAIDAVTATMRGLEKIMPLSAAHWQSAWDRHPDLYASYCELYRQRGIAQEERDLKASRVRIKRIQTSRPKQCPTCGFHTLHAEATP